MKKKIFGLISLITGGISGLLGVIGALGFCSAPWIVALFALLGLNSMILMTYNKLFFLAGFIFLSLAVLVYLKTRKNVCPPQETKSRFKWFEIVSIWILILVGSLLVYSNYRNFSRSSVAKQSQNQPQEAEVYLKFKQIKTSAIPSGIPGIYGKELGISFDEAQKATQEGKKGLFASL